MSISSVLRRLVLLKEGELAALKWSAAYFFTILCAYYIIRPVRETMGIERGADKLAWLMTGTMAVMFLVNPLFSLLVSRMPRRRFIPFTYRFFAANLVVFWVCLNTLDERHRVWLGYAFYIWLSVFNLFAVSVFWAFLADRVGREQSKRLFGLVGVGGTLGAICGAGLTTGLVRLTGPVHLLLISAVALEIAVWCFKALNRAFDRGTASADRPRVAVCPSCGHELSGQAGPGDAVRCPECGAEAVASPPPAEPFLPRPREPGPGVLDGVLHVVASPYLLLICLYLFLYAVMNTFLYMEQGRIVEAAITDRAARTAIFAQMDLYTNILTVLTQLFLTARVIKAFGVGWTLAVLPALSAVGFAALWFVSARAGADLKPALIVLIVFQVVRRGVHYALSQPTRQLLFAGLSPDVIYKSKPFIDTFVYRGGDLAGAWAPRAIVEGATRMGLAAASAVAMTAVPIAFLALFVGLMLGALQASRQREEEAAGQRLPSA